jgi:hypothetical protein
VDSYILAVKKAPDTDIRIYAIRKLGATKTNRKALKALQDALKLGVENIESYVPQNKEGPVKIRSEAAIALSNFTVEKENIILALRRTMMHDPSDIVQGYAAIAMGRIGAKSGRKIRKKNVYYFKRKISRTSKNKIRLIAMVVRAFGINRHSDARLFLNIMKTRGYGSIVEREIRKALIRIR